MLLIVPAIIFGFIGCGWVLTRSRWSWWVRIPGCIVIYPIGAYVGMIALLSLGIGIGYTVTGIRWLLDRLPF